MATFPCPYFTSTTKYPESGTRIQLGNSYMFTAPPTAPDQRVFHLVLTGMQYFVTSAGALDLEKNPERNMAVLEAFYNDHKTYLSFFFAHPVYGLLQCKFNIPLQIPEGIIGGNGVLQPLEIELVEMP